MFKVTQYALHTELYRLQMPPKEEVSSFLIFWSTHIVWKEKKVISYDSHWKKPASQCSQFCLFPLRLAVLATLVGKIQQGTNIQERLLNNPYVNEVTLRGQNPPLKCC